MRQRLIPCACVFLFLASSAHCSEEPQALASAQSAPETGEAPAHGAGNADAAAESASPASQPAVEQVCATLATAADTHELPVGFFIRLIWQESRFNPAAVSPVGAQGVAQFMPRVAAAMGLQNPFDPIEALPTSARLLRDLLRQFGNIGLAAAAYNAGPKRILGWLAGGRLPAETRHYVHTITGHPVERWRSTRLGYLDFDAPQRAPCQKLADDASGFLGQVPAPVVVVEKPRPRIRILARQKGAASKQRASKSGSGRRAHASPVMSAQRKIHPRFARGRMLSTRR